MTRFNHLLFHIILSFTALHLAVPSGFSASEGAVARLQESYGATPANRRIIYSEVISAGAPAGPDSPVRLARAVAQMQLAMDLEDEYLERMVAAAPGFAGLPVSAPPFLEQYSRAVAEFQSLKPAFPFTAEYFNAASLITRNWTSGPVLLSAALEFGTLHPASRFSPRLALLSGSRLLLEKNYPAARNCFEALWKAYPESNQALLAYRLVDKLGGTGGLALTPSQRLAWGRAQGLAGHSTLVGLLERHPGTPESEQTYVQIFKNFNQGFPQRSLSRNRRLSDLMEKYYTEYLRYFPSSSYLPEILTLRAEFNYRCGKKCESIARKNNHLGRRIKSSSRRNTGDRYSAMADSHFQRVREADSTAASLFPGSNSYYLVGLFTSRALFEIDEYDSALKKLISLLGDRPKAVMLTRIGSYTGLIYYFQGRFREAVNVLASLEREDLEGYEGWDRAMLFLGKAHLSLGDKDSAARVLTRLARAYPYTYYGIRARLLRNGLIESGRAPAWIAGLPKLVLPVFPDSFSSGGRLVEERAGQWQALGFFAEAAYIYSYGISNTPGDLLLRFRSHENFLRAGWYQRVLVNFRRPFNAFLQRGGVGLPSNFWDIAYLNPGENVPVIQEQGAKTGIPPGLVTAIIRQESNFNSRARSHAGAVGLMQLLPSVGRSLARREGLGNVSQASLYKPDLNIRLGVRFLANNLANYKGNIAIAISCYNADPRNLPAWLERSHPAGAEEEVFDLDLFIELIPLEETHDYNLQVLTNFWRYQELNGESANLFSWKLSSF